MGICTSLLLPATCLKPTYSLRKQLMLSYGCTALLTVSVCVIAAILSAVIAGQLVKDGSRSMMQTQVLNSIQTASEYSAEAMAERLAVHRGAVAMVEEQVRDILVGYPYLEYNPANGDLQVPFRDMETGTNMYPLHNDLHEVLRVDWDIERNNMVPSWIEENMRERESLAYTLNFGVSTSTASYYVQGTCNPDVVMEEGLNYVPYGYYESCTQAHSNLTTGGAIQPTNTSQWLSQASADLVPFFKALWESQPSILFIGVFFHNSGAGSSVFFPGVQNSVVSEYTSTGCEWMKEPNPFLPHEPIGTPEEIQRCHAAGMHVGGRDYNPMERPFCQKMALEPNDFHYFGPYRPNGNPLWVFGFGKALYDRLTKRFIGCVSFELSMAAIGEDLHHVDLDYTKMALVKTDGTIVSGGDWDPEKSTETIQIWESSWMDQSEWDHLMSDHTHNTSEWEHHEGQILQRDDGSYLTAYPIEHSASNSSIRTDFWVVYVFDGEIFDVFDEIDEAINDEVGSLIRATLMIGGVGLAVLLLAIYVVTRMLTRPLGWIESVAWKIVNHDSGSSRRGGEVQDGNESLLVVLNVDESPYSGEACVPQTEIRDLVQEFSRMIQGFSGEGASSVAKSTIHEIPNSITIQPEFQYWYQTPTHTLPENNHISDMDGNNSVGSNVSGKSKQLSSPSHGTTESFACHSKQLSESHPDCAAEPIMRSAPKTDVVDGPMLAKTDGRSSQKSESSVCCEVQQPMPVSVELAGKEEGGSSDQEEHDEQYDLVPTQPSRLHFGPNMTISPYHPLANTNNKTDVQVTQSSLYRWILLLIVVPQVLTAFCIAGLVSYSVLNDFPSWVTLSRDVSFDIEKASMRIAAVQRASLAESVLTNPIRDLYVLTRMAGWLLLGGVNRSEAFTWLSESSEKCKRYEAGQCPMDPEKNVCDCSWHDNYVDTCQAYDDFESRKFQSLSYFGKSQDVDPITGARNNSHTYPAFDSSPATTQWWNDTESMPGSWKASNASGYETTYDRLRVSSAIAPTMVAVYNYMNGIGEKHFLSAGVAFEADGMMVAFRGCDYQALSQMSHWVSDNSNIASSIRPELCPHGRYGFDPRCRHWYDQGKTLAAQGNNVFITAPYKFAFAPVADTTATSPLIDPRDNTHFGQTQIDFRMGKILSVAAETEALYTFIISPDYAGAGGDTVLGPGFELGSDPKWISDLVLPHDDDLSYHYRHFKNITRAMKRGEEGSEQFWRIHSSGPELIHIHYAPVKVRSLGPVRPDDFMRGFNVSLDIVYSIGVAQKDSVLFGPYDATENDVNTQVRNIQIVFLVVVVLLTLACTAFTGEITYAVTKPTLILLQVVRNINAGRINDDLPPLVGGSRESNKVYISFAKLFKIVRVSNTAFFSGNLQWAFHFISDALKLYRKIQDRKAIGVASNNLANTLFAMSLETKKLQFTDDEPSSSCCAEAAILYYNEAIAIASQDLDDAPLFDDKADYAQQLADRHFNRALFYLLTPWELGSRDANKKKGYCDLARAKALDLDVREYWLHNNAVLSNSDRCFEAQIRRIHGLAMLSGDVPAQDIWNARKLVEDGDQLLLAAWEEADAPLFREMGPIGRLQQLESALISLELASGNIEAAARSAMRMIVEDSYLLDSAFVTAADALYRFMNLESSKAPCWSSSATIATKTSIRKMLKTCKNACLDTGKGIVLCFALGNTEQDEEAKSETKRGSLSLYEQHCGIDDVVGLVGPNGEGGIVKKKGVRGMSEKELVLAACHDSTTGTPALEALSSALQLATFPEFSYSETFVVLVTDEDVERAEIDRLVSRRSSTEKKLHVNTIVVNLACKECCSSETFDRPRLSSTSRSAHFVCSCDRSIGNAFDRASTMIAGTIGCSKTSLCGIAMEKF